MFSCLYIIICGVYAAKLWNGRGKCNRGRRVLCLHGFQDNCASFDRLIPLLDDGNTLYLCLDWPNHGLSSGTPYGVRWTMENYALTVKRVVDHMRWPAFVCVGHSMGGQVAKLFAAVYSEHVEKLVLLDTAGPIETYPEEIVSKTRRSLDTLLKLEDRVLSGKSRPLEYDHPDQAFDRIRHRMYSALTGELLNRESCMVLLTRYLRPGGKKYMLANDVRLRVTYSEFFSVGQYADVVKRIKCPTLFIVATDSEAIYYGEFGAFAELYSANSNFRFVTVQGNHDVHMNYPHRIAPLIENFVNDKPLMLCKL